MAKKEMPGGSRGAHLSFLWYWFGMTLAGLAAATAVQSLAMPLFIPDGGASGAVRILSESDLTTIWEGFDGYVIPRTFTSGGVKIFSLVAGVLGAAMTGVQLVAKKKLERG